MEKYHKFRNLFEEEKLLCKINISKKLDEKFSSYEKYGKEALKNDIILAIAYKINLFNKGEGLTDFYKKIIEFIDSIGKYG